MAAKRQKPVSTVFPRHIELPYKRYIELLKITGWLQAWPDFLEMGDHQMDDVRNKIDSLLPDTLSESFYVDVQIESHATAVKGVTKRGQLVALLETDATIDAGEEETHVPILPKQRKKHT